MIDVAAVVYRFFDREERLLYVGVTARGLDRWTLHALEKPWWREVVSVRLLHFDTVEEALAAERALIEAEHPIHNETFNHGFRQIKFPKRRYTNRRAWRSGSIYQRQDGRWVAALRMDGRRVARYAQSRTDALHKLAELKEAALEVPDLAAHG